MVPGDLPNDTREQQIAIARAMREMGPHERDLAIGTSENVVDARRVLADRRVDRIMRVSEDDCA